MKKYGNYFLILLPILLLVAGSALAGHKNKHGAPQKVTKCGMVLTEPGKYKLVKDLLNCPGNGVLIEGSDITLNLKGYEISCADNELEVAGIGVLGELSDTQEPLAPVSNVTVKNGHVSNCKDGIVLVNTEDSKVMHMTSTGNTQWEREPGVWVYGTGITLWLSRNNVIKHNHTYSNASHGIGSWQSSGNLFKHNTSTGNGNDWEGAGINLSGEDNSRVLCNRIDSNTDGITLWPGQLGSSGNLLRGNFVSDNKTTGIGIFGFYYQDPASGQEWYYAMPSGNTIRKNIVMDNPWIDLFEAHWVDKRGALVPDPDGICENTWRKNQFQTEIGVPGCIGTPVELDEDDVCALRDDHDD